MFESARIDGANEFYVLWKIVVPLSKPVIMTMVLFYAVGHWETYFDSIMYLPDQNMQTLQVVLRRMLTPNAEMNADITIPTMTLQMAMVVFTTLRSGIYSGDVIVPVHTEVFHERYHVGGGKGVMCRERISHAL